jgi:hypothetical protein
MAIFQYCQISLLGLDDYDRLLDSPWISLIPTLLGRRAFVCYPVMCEVSADLYIGQDAVEPCIFCQLKQILSSNRVDSCIEQIGGAYSTHLVPVVIVVYAGVQFSTCVYELHVAAAQLSRP